MDPETKKVDKVFNKFPLGVLVRENGDWSGVSVDDSGIRDMAGYAVYQLEWDKIEELADDEYDPEVIKKYDAGELELDELLEVAELIYDGTTED